jgi:pimeloyl-ACP methyl ester carboxylesterase
VRRIVGVVWDIVTFWPRASHPFAPPCYAERAVPELVTRLMGKPNDPVILSGHSQGGLIAAACIFQLPEARRRTVFLLTFGTQLTRFYGRAFPAFFGRDARTQLAAALTARQEGAQRRGDPQWRSLWRRTDPLGWPLSQDASVHLENNGPLDVRVSDPEAMQPSGGEVVDPPVRQHSDYPRSPEYLVQRNRAPPSGPGGAGLPVRLKVLELGGRNVTPGEWVVSSGFRRYLPRKPSELIYPALARDGGMVTRCRVKHCPGGPQR